ncbi:MAG: phosphoethanolamine transferase [Gammaproteobacteria bacterium]|nr:phosphoethanolamine transferase [Gammaproteobacteria bacterium]
MHRTRVAFGTVATLASVPLIAMLLWSLRGAAAYSVVILALTTVLVAFLVATCAGTWRRFFLIAFPFWLLACAYTAYALLSGGVPGRTAALLLSGASWEEIRGLFGLWPDKWLLLPIAGVVVAYLLLALRAPATAVFRSHHTTLAGRVLLVLAVPLIGYAAQASARVNAGLALNPYIGSLLFFGLDIPRAHAELSGALVVKTPYHAVRTATREEVHVLIVGESARRASWSAYGYARPTTPFLDRLRHEGGLFLLSDAMADANLTEYAVPLILTGLTPREVAESHPFTGTLLDLAKEAGYSTAWLVNQDMSVSTSIGVTADHLEYPPDLHEGFFGRRSLDEVLLPAYRRELMRAGRARLIGMHVMGSHWEYYLRYPKSFQRFGSPQRQSLLTSRTTSRALIPDLADTYDDSVLYTDWFFEQVIEAAQTLPVPATVTFVPDHGEASPYLDNGAVGHGSAHYVPAEFEIPAFVWVNAAYRAAHPAKVAALAANCAKEIRSHDFFHTVADLMGIGWPGADPRRSFASAQFVPDATGEYLMRGVLARGP